MYHFMDYKAGCPSSSAIADGFNGFAIHLAHHDVMLWAVSRAPLAKLQEYKKRIGWTFPWASSFGSDFNFDFKLSFTGEEPMRFVDRTLRREAVSDRESAKGSRRLDFGENRESHGDVSKRSRFTPDMPTKFARIGSV